MEVELTVLPVLKCKKFHQKCYMGQELMLNLGARIGSFVQVENEGRSVICSVWPRSDLLGSAIQYSCSVHCIEIISDKTEEQLQAVNNDENTKLKPVQTLQSQYCNKIRILAACKASLLTVDVIISDIKNLKNFRNFRSRQQLLQEYCCNCLYRLCVVKSCIIDCKSSKYANLLGITHIIVNNITADGYSEGQTGSADNITKDEYSKIQPGYIITQSTKINVDSIHSTEWFEQMSDKIQIKQLGGLNSVVNMLLDLIKLPLEHREKFRKLGVDPPRGILLRGPPGCGKTSVVQYVAKVSKAFLISINGPEIFGPRPGETESNLRGLFEKAVLMSEEGSCILFIDEIDSVCPRKGKSGGVQESRVTGQLLSLMDGLSSDKGILVIGATNRPSSLDPALRRPGRLDREVMISAPNVKQRREILQSYIENIPVHSDIDLDNLSRVTNGYVGADLVSLCHEAAYLAIAEGGRNDGEITLIREDHFLHAVKKICPSMQKGSEGVIDLRPVSWTDIGGLENIKTQMKQAIEWPLKHPGAFRRMGLPPPKGVLLYGPPGCCKTTLVRAAATACYATFLSISGAQLYSPYVGDSERLIAEVFQKARASSPAILFLDEIDSIVGKRSESGRSGVQERVLSALLNEMDGVGIRLDDSATSSCGEQKVLEGSCQDVKQSAHQVCNLSDTDSSISVLVVAATNRPDLLDEALVRPGRIDKMLYVPPPDTQARREILRVYTKSMTLSDSDLDLISSQTNLYTGADIENLCREAALCALTEDMEAQTVTISHFEKALTAVKSSLTDELVQHYSNVNFSKMKHQKKK